MRVDENIANVIHLLRRMEAHAKNSMSLLCLVQVHFAREALIV